MQPHESTTDAALNSAQALAGLNVDPANLQDLPECLGAFCRSLAEDLPSLEAQALAAQVQDRLKPGQDMDRACPVFLARLIQDPLWGLSAASTQRSLRQLTERVGEYFIESSQGRPAAVLSQMLPTLLNEAADELGQARGGQRDRKVLRALRLIWAATWRGPRCQALAAKACRRVWSRPSEVAQAQRVLLLEFLQGGHA